MNRDALRVRPLRIQVECTCGATTAVANLLAEGMSFWCDGCSTHFSLDITPVVSA